MGRRRFLTLAALPLVLPSGVIGQPGRPGANERVVTGHIGVGAHGRALLQRLQTSAAAVCDVDERHRNDGAAIAGPGVRLFNDYRALLDIRDIDAVVIATPDHWHAIQAIHACEAGKDVYLETPAVRLPGEMVQLLRAATWFGRVVHTGAPTAPLPAAGTTTARVTGPENPTGGAPEDDVAHPISLDWDRWLGPAPPRPYNPARAHYQWRWLLDTGGGQIRAAGAGLFTRALATLAPEGALGTVRVEATGKIPAEGIWDCPLGLEADFTLASGRKMYWVAEGTAPAQLQFGDGAAPESTHGGDALTLEEHLEAWLQAVRLRDHDAVGLERACAAAVLGTLANTAAHLGRRLTWEPGTGAIDDAQAARMLAFTGRGGYTL